MRKIALAIVTIMSTSVFASAETAPTANVSLTAAEIVTISAALNKIAARCADDREACAIGLRNSDIQSKLEAAFKTIPTSASQPDKK